MNSPRGKAFGWWAAATIFVSAFLLFQVQPVISKKILPWFGGSPAVWTTCMLFFQLVLLGGYGYAHWLTKKVAPRRQGIIHGVLILLALATLPITPGDWWKPADGAWPSGRILLLLAAKVGLPYFLLSSTGPLVQAWFSAAYPGRSPYRLYALSNIGSLLALLTYPVLIEPLLPVNWQGWSWSLSFGLFALLLGRLGWLSYQVALAGGGPEAGDSPEFAEGLVARHERPPSGDSALAATAPQPARVSPPVAAAVETPGFFTKAAWLALPALASVAFLSVTNHICQDIAVAPFMWVVPLSLYLISFIICFDSDRWYVRPVWGAAAVLGLLSLGVLERFDDWSLVPGDHNGWVMNKVLWATQPLILWIKPWSSAFEDNLVFQALGYLLALFYICMVCHGELVRLKPGAQQLTLYYVLISAGGAAGGLFVALLCPIFFPLHYELALAVLCGYIVGWAAIINHGRESWLKGRDLLQWSGAFLVVGGVIFLGSCMIEAPGREVLAIKRNFYGSLAVKKRLTTDSNNQETVYGIDLYHGRIWHGFQYSDPARKREPTTYYANHSGAGVAVEHFPRTPGEGLKVAVVGLGTGTMAAHGQRGDHYRFYEIDPKVVQLSSEYFSYRRDAVDAGCRVDVVLGDARIQMEHEPDQNYDVIVLDAFSGDAIPAHLLTVESLALYERHLRKGPGGKSRGVIAVHISNRYLDLEPVCAALARAHGYEAVAIHAGEEGGDLGDTSSDYVLLTHNREFLELGAVAGLSQPLLVDPADEVLWTDQYNSLFSIMQSEWLDALRTRLKAWRGETK